MLRYKAIAAVLALSLALPLANAAAAGHKKQRDPNSGYQGQVYQGHKHKYERKKHRRQQVERRHRDEHRHAKKHHRRQHHDYRLHGDRRHDHRYGHRRHDHREYGHRRHDHRHYGHRKHGRWHKHYGGHRHRHGGHDHYGHKHRGHKHGGHYHSSKKHDDDAYLVAAGVLGLVAAAAIIDHQDSYRDTPKEAITWSEPHQGSGAIYGEPGRVVEHPDGDYCREYHRDAVVAGRQQQVYGTACLQPDGSWEIVQER